MWYCAYAFSDGEGTLLAYGQATYNQIVQWGSVFFPRATLIVGPADGTGE